MQTERIECLRTCVQTQMFLFTIAALDVWRKRILFLIKKDNVKNGNQHIETRTSIQAAGIIFLFF